MCLTQNFSIDRAVGTDVPDLLAMISELAAFEHLQHELEVTQDSLRDALFGEHRAANAFMARVEGRPAGYAVYFPTFSTFKGRPGVFLEDLYVRPAHRTRGLGRALLRSVAREGVIKNPGRYEWIALHWNKNALEFYRNLGAKLLTDWVFVRMSGEPLRAFIKGGL